MERVYGALKGEIMRGGLAPGMRLDPARLAHDLNASATPVRDALHRLAGERMVDCWPQEGFHVPLPSEPSLRDLYGWHREILLAALRNLSSRAGGVRMPLGASVEDGPSRAPQAIELFGAIAENSDNLEHRYALTNASDRLSLARIAEVELLGEAGLATQAIRSAWVDRDLTALRREIARYHRTRLLAVPSIAAALRRMAAQRQA